MTSSSLRSQLLRWLFVPLAALWLLDVVLVSAAVRGSVNASFDRALYGSLLAIGEHVTLGSDAPVVDLPPVALEMLQTSEQEHVFYRVSYRPPGANDDRTITGYSDLPAPAGIDVGKAVFQDASYRGELVRIASLRTYLPQDRRMTVLVQVAETFHSRRAAMTALAGRALGSEVALIFFAGALVWFAITRGLRPLRRVSREVADRSAADLTPVHTDVPREVLPLVEATNGLMARVRQAMESQRRFIADASHQLRTPLAVLRAEAEAALRENDPASMRKAIEQLRVHSEATGHLATQLLSLARAEPGAPPTPGHEILDLTAVAREACAALVPGALSRGVDLGFDGNAGVLLIRGHDLLVREMVSNLVDNAIHYGRDRGRVTVGVGWAQGGGPALFVEDDGPGIPPGERARVLERFYRVPGTPGTGAGLGLAIVTELAHRHGASVHLLDGADGRGFRVEIRFPTFVVGK